VKFDVVGEIEDVETIAAGPSVKVRKFLRKTYGRGNWRKLKGVATVRFPNGRLHRVDSTGMRLTVLENGISKLKVTWTSHETTH